MCLIEASFNARAPAGYIYNTAVIFKYRPDKYNIIRLRALMSRGSNTHRILQGCSAGIIINLVLLR